MSDAPITTDALMRDKPAGWASEIHEALQYGMEGVNGLALAAWNRLRTEFLRNTQHIGIFNTLHLHPERLRLPQDYAELAGFQQEKIERKGSYLAIWHKPAADHKQPVYVVFHGCGGHWADLGEWRSVPVIDRLIGAPPAAPNYDRQYRLKWLKALADTGAEVIAVHLSGQGASRRYQRDPGESHFAQDVKAVADYLEKRGIKGDEVIVAGESLGGAVAAMLAVEMTTRKSPPAVVGLINSFASLTQVITSKFAWLPKNWSSALKHKFETAKDRLQQLNPERTMLYLANAPGDTMVNYENQADLKSAATNRDLITEMRDLKDGHMRQGLDCLHTSWDAQKVVDDLRKTYRRSCYMLHRPQLVQR